MPAALDSWQDVLILSRITTMTKKLTAEFIGTFFLFATIALSVIPPVGPLPPLAIGVVLAVMVYACGHLSGAHFNPAVTVGLWVRKAAPTGDVAPYIAVQVIAAIVAGLVVMAMKPDYSAWLENQTVMPLVPALFAELIFTFGLMWTILSVAVSKTTAGNHYYGIAIGGFVMAGAFAVGPISGGAFNPAVAVGLWLTGLLPIGHMLLYLIVTVVGASIAAFVHRAIGVEKN